MGKDLKFLLMYSPLQFAPHDTVKPDGSLSLPYVSGALRAAGYEVKILDACVGAVADKLSDTILNPTPLPSGLVRVGMSNARIAEEIADYDVIGITSIFTSQTTMVLKLASLIKQIDGSKIVIAGGVNARYQIEKFLAAGVDIICLSEAEGTVVDLANHLAEGTSWKGVPGIAFKDGAATHINPMTNVSTDLDELPIPAWDLLPLSKYWELSRPHGGDFEPGTCIKYAAMMTSRGCPFACMYCHISKQTEGSLSGNIGALRYKSLDRVMQEIAVLKGLGTEYVFVEDDSLLAKKDRAVRIFQALRGEGLKLIDVNGVNIIHLYESKGGKMSVDYNLLESMAECGFEKLSLPFESGSQRILDKYASRKWRIDKVDTDELIRATVRSGITPLGNYTIGYPDETFEEMLDTLMMARRHMEAGLKVASFFVIVPFPGTTLFDIAVKNGKLDPAINPDEMRWTRSVFKNTLVSPDALEYIRQVAWKLLNRPDFVSSKEKTGFKSLMVLQG